MKLPIQSRLQRLSLKGMRYLEEVYDTDARRTLFMSGRQVAKSTTLGNKLLSYSVLRPHFKSLYVSPAQLQTSQFSNDRIKLPIYYSDHLSTFVSGDLVDRVNHRQFINGSEIRLRYAFLNADRIRGIMTDLLCIDELQDILVNLLPVIEETLFTSPYKLRCYAGTPKSEDNTLAYYWYNYSTQNEWVVPCDRGSQHGGKRHWNVVGEKNLPDKSEDGLVCNRCKKSIDADHDVAQWAAGNPEPKDEKGRLLEVPFEGFRIPQLISPFADWREILDSYGRYSRQRFYNEKLGLPFDSGLRPLVKEDIKRNCDPEASIYPGPFKYDYNFARSVPDTWMGLDWGTGENSFSYVTIVGYSEGRLRLLYFKRFVGEEIEPDRQLAAIHDLVRLFSVKRIGCDYGGGFYMNDKLTRIYGLERVFKFQYVAQHKQKVRWDSQLGRYLLRRSEIMSDIFQAIKRGVFTFPRWEEMDQSMAKEMLSIHSEYNETLRLTMYNRSPGTPDDGFHSFLYAFMVSNIDHRRVDVILPTREPLQHVSA